MFFQKQDSNNNNYDLNTPNTNNELFITNSNSNPNLLLKPITHSSLSLASQNYSNYNNTTYRKDEDEEVFYIPKLKEESGEYTNNTFGFINNASNNNDVGINNEINNDNYINNSNEGSLNSISNHNGELNIQRNNNSDDDVFLGFKRKNSNEFLEKIAKQQECINPEEQFFNCLNSNFSFNNNYNNLNSLNDSIYNSNNNGFCLGEYTDNSPFGKKKAYDPLFNEINHFERNYTRMSSIKSNKNDMFNEIKFRLNGNIHNNNNNAYSNNNNPLLLKNSILENLEKNCQEINTDLTNYNITPKKDINKNQFNMKPENGGSSNNTKLGFFYNNNNNNNNSNSKDFIRPRQVNFTPYVNNNNNKNYHLGNNFNQSAANEVTYNFFNRNNSKPTTPTAINSNGGISYNFEPININNNSKLFFKSNNSLNTPFLENDFNINNPGNFNQINNYKQGNKISSNYYNNNTNDNNDNDNTLDSAYKEIITKIIIRNNEIANKATDINESQILTDKIENKEPNTTVTSRKQKQKQTTFVLDRSKLEDYDFLAFTKKYEKNNKNNSSYKSRSRKYTFASNIDSQMSHKSHLTHNTNNTQQTPNVNKVNDYNTNTSLSLNESNDVDKGMKNERISKYSNNNINLSSYTYNSYSKSSANNNNDTIFSTLDNHNSNVNNDNNNYNVEQKKEYKFQKYLDEIFHKNSNKRKSKRYDKRNAYKPTNILFYVNKEKHIIPEPEKQTKNPCFCKSTKCIKLYCDCFNSGKYCIDCDCVDCFNIPEYDDIRNKAIEHIKQKNKVSSLVELTDKKKIAAERGCKCKNSSCLKNYCECFRAGLGCGEHCKCEGCANDGCLAKNRKIKKRKIKKANRKRSSFCEGNSNDSNNKTSKSYISNKNSNDSNSKDKIKVVNITKKDDDTNQQYSDINININKKEYVDN